MWNKITMALTIASITASVIFGYLNKQQRDLNNRLSVDNFRYRKELAYANSINKVLSNVNAELDSANAVYEKENAKIKWQLKQVQNDLDSILKELKDQPIDSIAEYIVFNYLGTEYKVQQINDSTFVAFQEITVRDIANQHELFKALKRRFKLLSRELDAKDTLMKKQAKKIVILRNTADTLLQKYSKINTDYFECEKTVQDLTTEVDKQKGLKRIGFITSGGILLVLLIVL